MIKDDKVSVIIPTYNSWSTLKDSINSIQKQTLKPYEIIVVDNASIDNTPAKVKSMFPRIKLIQLDVNTGVTGGRNKGIEIASSESNYVLFFDHDMVADKNMLKELVNIFNIDPKIGIVTPKIYYWGNKKKIWSAGTGINLWTGQVLFRGGLDQGQFETPEEVQVAPATLLVSKIALKKTGNFDDIYFATYEDTDFCFRAKKYGFKTYYSPKAIAYHKISFEPKDDAARILSRAYWVGKNRIIFMKRFSNNFFIFSLFVPGFVLYYLILAIKYRKLKNWLWFLKGTIEGYLNFSFTEKYIPFSYINLIHNLMDGDIKTILDLGCGSGRLMKALSVNEQWEVTGVDIDKKSVEAAETIEIYKKVVAGDIEKVATKLTRDKQKFDLVLCSQILEHLPKKKGEKILGLLDKLSKKRIVLSTPNGFLEQIEESLATHNPHQEHISGWEIEDFEKRGYAVRGVGSRLFWSFSGLARSKNRYISFLSRLLSYLVSPFIYFFPMYSINLLALKKISG